MFNLTSEDDEIILNILIDIENHHYVNAISKAHDIVGDDLTLRVELIRHLAKIHLNKNIIDVRIHTLTN